MRPIEASGWSERRFCFFRRDVSDKSSTHSSTIQQIMIPMKALITLLPVIALIGCSNPADSVPKANVSSSTNSTGEASKKTPDSEGRYYSFGPDSSSVEFVGSKVTGSHKGGFRKFAGELRAVNGQ